VIALPPVNIVAAIAAAVAAFLIGGIYWAVVTPAWSRYLGSPPEEGRPTPARLGIAFITRIVVAGVLAVFVAWSGAEGAGGGAEVGLLAWLGFVVPPNIGQAAFERKPWQVVALGLPESLMAFVVMGIIVGAWT
jgi:hypothetical protein